MFRLTSYQLLTQPRHLVLAVLALLVTNAFAQEWMQISRVAGVLVEIDKSSFNVVADGRFRYWERTTFDPPRRTSRGEIEQLIILREANCAEQYDEVVQMLMKAPGSVVQDPLESNRERSRRHAVPGSTIKTILDEACPTAVRTEGLRRF